jgi:hypothetical protein
VDILHAHLQKCSPVPSNVKERASADAQRKKNKESIPITPTRQLRHSIRTPVKSPSTKSAKKGPPQKKLHTSKLTANAQHKFDSDMCQMFASCGWAWNSANNPQLRQFFSKWVPEVQVPDRRKLSGPLLDAEVRKVEDRMKARVEGQLAMGQCDGWKNISKTSVIGTMITVDGEV